MQGSSCVWTSEATLARKGPGQHEAAAVSLGSQQVQGQHGGSRSLASTWSGSSSDMQCIDLTATASLLGMAPTPCNCVQLGKELGGLHVSGAAGGEKRRKNVLLSLEPHTRARNHQP